MRRLILFSLIFGFSLVNVFTFSAQAQAPRGRGGAQGRATPPTAKETQPKLKAIWEPVNVREDVELRSVYFVSADEGWVAGGKTALTGGVIFHTIDGGATWELQLGEPQSSDRAYQQLSFLNPTLGWATQSTTGGDHNLLRTNDGKTWAPVGTVAQHRTDYRFVSADVGFVTAGDTIYRTQDGGRRWQPAYRCAIKAEVKGLTRDVACEFDKIDFVNPTIGYAISREIEAGAGFVLAKTADAGSNWTTAVILPGENGKEGALRFTNPSTGVLRTINGKLFHTSDGGATWTGAAGTAQGKPDIDFAGESIGWMIAYRTMTYTTNGGKSWVSRELAFPANVNAFCLVQRDRGYAVGDHGMVYRYRVVPMDYAGKNVLPAPMM